MAVVLKNLFRLPFFSTILVKIDTATYLEMECEIMPKNDRNSFWSYCVPCVRTKKSRTKVYVC